MFVTAAWCQDPRKLWLINYSGSGMQLHSTCRYNNSWKFMIEAWLTQEGAFANKSRNNCLGYTGFTFLNASISGLQRQFIAGLVNGLVPVNLSELYVPTAHRQSRHHLRSSVGNHLSVACRWTAEEVGVYSTTSHQNCCCPTARKSNELILRRLSFVRLFGLTRSPEIKLARKCITHGW